MSHGPCPDEIRLLMYLDGALSAGEEAEMKRHLEDCAPCRGWVATTGEVGRRIARGAGVRPGAAGEACPDDTVVAAFADGVLGEAKRAAFRAHLAGCPVCRHRVADLVRDLSDAGGEEPARVPDWALRKAAALVGGASGGDLSSRPALTVVAGESPAGRAAGGRSRPNWLRRGVLAAAAAVALLFGLRYIGRPTAPGPSGQEPVMRQVPDGQAAFAVIAPPDGAAVSAAAGSRLDLAWTPSLLENVIGYTVTVRDADGNEVWSGDSSGTGAGLPASAGLAPGHTYTWWVTARTEFGSHEETRSATFSVIP